MEKLESIPVNFWDDFYGDGYAPEGKIQQTYCHIEEYGDSEFEDYKERCLDFLFDIISKIDITNVIINNQGSEITFENITHKQLDNLVETLENSNLSFDGVPFEFYSES